MPTQKNERRQKPFIRNKFIAVVAGVRGFTITYYYYFVGQWGWGSLAMHFFLQFKNQQKVGTRLMWAILILLINVFFVVVSIGSFVHSVDNNT